MNRNPFLDFVKGILILLVVIGHAIQYVAYQNEGYWGDPLFTAIYMFHMPLFMTLSGYLSYSGMQKEKIVPYLTGKAHAYVIPVLAWAVFSATILVAHSYRHLSVSYIIAVICASVGGPWFLWALFGSLVLTVSAKLTGRFFPVTYVLLLIAIFFMPDEGGVFLLKYLFPFFQIGYLLAAYGVPRLNDTWRKVAFVISGISFIMCHQLWNENAYVYLSKTVLGGGNFGNVILRYLAGFVVSCFVIMSLERFYGKTPERVRRSICGLGRDTICIYLLQGYAYVIIYRLAKYFCSPVTNILTGSAMALSVGIVVTYTCWGFGSFMAQYYWAGRLFFGKRKNFDRVLA